MKIYQHIGDFKTQTGETIIVGMTSYTDKFWPLVQKALKNKSKKVTIAHRAIVIEARKLP